MYFETQVIFTEEIPTKNGVKEKRTRRNFLVECDSVSVAEAKVNANADAENPEKTTLVEFDSDEVEALADESELPGFGIMAAGASLLFVSRRFRN